MILEEVQGISYLMICIYITCLLLLQLGNFNELVHYLIIHRLNLQDEVGVLENNIEQQLLFRKARLIFVEVHME
jgi:hypothetical protein